MKFREREREWREKEHNFSQNDYADCRARAAHEGFLWIASHKPLSSTQAQGTGTGILIPLSSIEKEEGETATTEENKTQKEKDRRSGGVKAALAQPLIGRSISIKLAFALRGCERAKWPA